MSEIKLTIDEVIEHCRKTCEMAELMAQLRDAEITSKQYWEHKQVAEWLKELKQYRALGTVEEVTNQKHNLSVAYKCIEELQQKDWISFEQREADEEEKHYWRENYEVEIEYMLCGRLPDEDEEIIVSYSNGCVGEDIFMRDGCDCYLDSGNELVTEAIAWMPKPQPYKKNHDGEITEMVERGGTDAR